MIDHIYLPVTDLKRSETFYGAMLGEVRQYWGNYCCISRLTPGKYGFNWGEQIMLVVIGNSFSAEYLMKGLYEKTVGRFSEWTSGVYPSTEEDAYAYQVARDMPTSSRFARSTNFTSHATSGGSGPRIASGEIIYFASGSEGRSLRSTIQWKPSTAG
jgi:hypothetical protein